MAALIGTGLAITFQSGILAEITSASWSGVTREQIESSHMGTTGGRTYIPGTLYDSGSLEVGLIFDNPDAAWDTAMAAAAETVTVTFSNGNTWAASGSMQEFEWTAPLEDRMTATATIKLSGDITVAAS